MHVKQMSNRKYPGKDLVPVFWLKSYPVCMIVWLNNFKIFQTSDIPCWLVSGRTILLSKCAAKGPVASNYHHNLSSNLMSGILACKMLHHKINENELLASEQKGVCPGSHGTKD